MNTALVLDRGGMRWSRVRWHKGGRITFDAPVLESSNVGLWVGEREGIAIVKYNGQFQYAAPAGAGKGEEFLQVVTMLANPDLRKRVLGKER